MEPTPTIRAVLADGSRMIGRYVRAHPISFAVGVFGAANFAAAIVASTVIVGRVTDSLIVPVLDRGEALTEWVNALSDGLDTPVGERGSQLSAGERQLVALIRAWLVQPDLLVLDEATSAVDPALEVQLRRAIDRLIAGRTSITVAHRLSTAEASDEVLVFDAGRLVERGTHDELLVAGGAYAGLHEDWTTGMRV